MPKKGQDFTEQITVLLRDDGTKEALTAIAYFRGDGGSYAGPVRDACASYVREWLARLTPAERKRFDEILGNVRVKRNMERAIKAG